MSYILEALKKSEYARQQGRVANLASYSPLEVAGSAAPTGQRLLLRIGGALLLVIAVAGWWRPWQAPPALLPGTGPAAPAAVTPLPGERPAMASASPPSSTPVAATPPATAPVTLAPSAQTPRSAPPAASALPRAELPAPAIEPVPLPAPASTSPPQRVLAFHELPPTVRERIPRLMVSGFSHAEQANLRLAVINDRVLRQGEEAAPGVTLERIGSDGVVLSFAGYRFRPPR